MKAEKRVRAEKRVPRSDHRTAIDSRLLPGSIVWIGIRKKRRDPNQPMRLIPIRYGTTRTNETHTRPDARDLNATPTYSTYNSGRKDHPSNRERSPPCPTELECETPLRTPTFSSSLALQMHSLARHSYSSSELCTAPLLCRSVVS